ncbi:MAG TPA: three-Cys-motif partner protein TcmP [Dongiaceae bacterium]|nr:three-Cys-motif partner protein TcmP [Dongiaceae bacterium]
MSKKISRSSEGTHIAQVFGGPWSLIKTDVVERYLQFFNTALKNQGFKKLYIDAFAGSGAFQYVRGPSTGDLFAYDDAEAKIHSGSAQRALSIRPPFDEVVFIEENQDNVRALERLIKAIGHPAVKIEHGDANSILRDLCKSRDWNTTRGVVFLDPFGLHVEWETLKAIAATRAFDVWYLFALAGTVRNLPRLASQLDTSKRAAVTRVLGTDEWFGRFYNQPQGASLFEASPGAVRRTATIDEIEAYVRERLLTIFSLVEAPLRLKAPGNKSLFSLFFAVSNPSSRAKELAQKGASFILSKK